MNKILKISLFWGIILIIFMCNSYAETTNLYNNIKNETSSENEISDDNEENTITDNNLDDFTFNEENEEENEEEINNDISTLARTTNSGQTTRTNTISSIPEANLGLNNILCIILIAIGILIVLLAIAILIRLNKH